MFDVRVRENVLQVYQEKDFQQFFDELVKQMDWCWKWKYDDKGNRIGRKYYLNLPVSFDIETSSFYNGADGKFYTSKQKNDFIFNQTLKVQGENKKRVLALKLERYFYKCACMYAWMMCFGTENKLVVVGRTWDEWLSFMNALRDNLQLNEDRQMIIYTHNLSFEFGFIQNFFTWKDYLVSDKVVYKVETDGVYYENPNMPTGKGWDYFDGFTFKDSLILSGVKLAKLPDIMSKYSKNAFKLEGFLDYDKVHHSQTPLTQKEWAYNIMDVITLNWYIREKMEENGNKITRIPMTKTGELRSECRDRMFYSDGKKFKNDSKRLKYKEFLAKMRINYSQYKQVRRAFEGGFTHASMVNAGKILVNKVISADLASAYPAACFKKYPMSEYKELDVSKMEDIDFDYYLDHYACIFDATIYDLKPRDEENINYDLVESVISISKCYEYARDYPDCAPIFPISNEFFYNNNGRLRRADKITLSLTEIQWEYICEFYDFPLDKVEISNFRYAKKDYLPKSLLLFLIELFTIKTKYKPFDGTDTKEGLMYKRSKEFINSVYGMIATALVRESFKLEKNEKTGFNEIVNNMSELTDELRKNRNNPEKLAVLMNKEDLLNAKKLDEYFDNGLTMDKDNVFLCYQWAPYITAYVRQSIFSIIQASSEHGKYYHVYSDTDSAYFIKNMGTLTFIEEYNQNIDEEMNTCFDYYNLPHDLHKVQIPGTNKFKCLGHFEIENDRDKHGNIIPYKAFCTVGAKRYLKMLPNGEIKLTIAGLNKKSIDYLCEKYGRIALFKHFSNFDIEVDEEHTGKLAATYERKSREGIVTDYLGKTIPFAEESFIHLEKVPFNFSSSEYEMFLESDERLELIGSVWEAD